MILDDLIKSIDEPQKKEPEKKQTEGSMFSYSKEFEDYANAKAAVGSEEGK